MAKNEVGLMAEAASMYYEQHLTEKQIADILFCSRSKVSRLISEALRLGIVTIHIDYPVERVLSLEKQIESIYHIKSAIVIRNYRSPYEILLKRIGKATANLIDDLIEKDSFVGVAWGKTVKNVVDQMQPKEKKNLTVIQVMGTPSNRTEEGYNSLEIVLKFREKYGGDIKEIFSPLVVESQLVRDSLLSEPIIRETIRSAQKCKYLVTSLGYINSLSLGAWREHLDSERMQRIKLEGAVGVLCGHFIKSDGSIVDQDLDKKIIGLGLDDIQKIPNVIAAVCGEKKEYVLKAALAGKYIDYLVTDENLALKLIK